MKNFFGKLEHRIFMIIVLTTVASSIAVFTILYNMYHGQMVDDIRERTRIVNLYAQRAVDISSFGELNTREDEAKPVYKDVQEALNVIRQVANVRYLYTAKRNSEGQLIYQVDGLDLGSSDFRRVGDIIEPEIVDRLNTCLSGTRVEADDIMNTEWGPIFATCWPVEQGGTVLGALCMEFDAESLYKRNIRTTAYSIAASLFIAIVFILLARVVLARVSEPFYKKLAYTDLLTGVGNRNAFELDIKELEGAMERGGAESSICVVAYDLNRLKEINDCFGHAAGDVYIKKMGDLLRSASFSAQGGHYRIGGDEFATLIMGGDCRLLQAELDRLFSESRNSVMSPDFFEFSYGVAQYEPGRDRNLHDLLTRADAEMYCFKSTVKNGGIAPPRSGVNCCGQQV